MEQNIQQVEQVGVETKLPIRTKIAALILLIISIAIICLQSVLFSEGDSGLFIMFYLFPMILVGLLNFVFTIFLLKRKKWAWFFTLSVNLVMILLVFLFWGSAFRFLISYGIGRVYNPTPTIVMLILIPIFIFSYILLLLDRKNFWKVAR